MPSIITPGQGGLPRVVIDHPSAKGDIYLQGAHLASWQPAGQKQVIFMSPQAIFAPGVPLRGGVPVCFPWFGPNAKFPDAPAHGFARTRAWDLVDDAVNATADAATVRFRLNASNSSDRYWPHAATVDLEYALGSALGMKLIVRNDGQDAFTFESALHTYFAVSDVRNVTVGGLSGVEYLSKAEGGMLKTDSEPAVTFTAETDRVYRNTDATCTINDPGWYRRIVVAKTGSKSTVVWNPFEKRASQLKDLGAANWPGFVCVETANVGEQAVRLEPKATHEMTVTVTLLPHSGEPNGT